MLAERARKSYDVLMFREYFVAFDESGYEIELESGCRGEDVCKEEIRALSCCTSIQDQ